MCTPGKARDLRERRCGKLVPELCLRPASRAARARARGRSSRPSSRTGTCRSRRSAATATATPAAAARRRAAPVRAGPRASAGSRRLDAAIGHARAPSATVQQCSKRSAIDGSWVVTTSAAPVASAQSSSTSTTCSPVRAVELARRLVGEDQPRAGRRARGRSRRAGPARPRARRAAAHREADAYECERARAPLRAAAGLRLARQQQRQRDVLEDGERGQQARALEDHADGAGPQGRGSPIAGQSSVAGGRRLEPREQMQERALARARGADDRDLVALRNGAVGRPQRDDRAAPPGVVRHRRLAAADEGRVAHAATRPSIELDGPVAASASSGVVRRGDDRAHRPPRARRQQRDDLARGRASRARPSARRRAAAADRWRARRRGPRARARRPRAASGARARGRRARRSRARRRRARPSSGPPVLGEQHVASTSRWREQVVALEEHSDRAAAKPRRGAASDRREMRSPASRTMPPSARRGLRGRPAASTCPSPDGPMMATISPGSAVSETPRSASVSSSPAW